MMRVIGIDPGLRVTGYGVIDYLNGAHKVVDAGIIKVSPDQPMNKRLLAIYNDFKEIIDEHHPDILAIEELYAHYAHPKTAIMMGHARGIFLMAAAQINMHVDDFSATRIKKSLIGYGRASKEQMQQAVATQLKLSQLPTPNDVADALAIAICCINEHQRENLIL